MSDIKQYYTFKYIYIYKYVYMVVYIYIYIVQSSFGKKHITLELSVVVSVQQQSVCGDALTFGGGSDSCNCVRKRLIVGGTLIVRYRVRPCSEWLDLHIEAGDRNLSPRYASLVGFAGYWGRAIAARLQSSDS